MAAQWISEALRPAETVEAPEFAVPKLACDAHMHVFGAIERYPGVADAKYTKPNGDLGEYLAVAGRLRLERMVFVQAKPRLV